MEIIKLKQKEILTITVILDRLADGDELYWGYSNMEKDREYLKKILKKLKKHL